VLPVGSEELAGAWVVLPVGSEELAGA